MMEMQLNFSELGPSIIVSLSFLTSLYTVVKLAMFIGEFGVKEGKRDEAIRNLENRLNDIDAAKTEIWWKVNSLDRELSYIRGQHDRKKTME